VQKIDVYSFDHRPKVDQGHSYTWKRLMVVLKFLDHEECPFASEFLDEVSSQRLVFEGDQSNAEL
jgi:hypothetical protein